MKSLNILFLLCLLFIVTSCADKIVTKADIQSVNSSLIIYNKIDLSVQPDKLQSQIVVVDSAGMNPQNWAVGFVSAAAPGKVAYTTGETGQHFEVIVSKNDNSQKHTIFSSVDPTINVVLFPILSIDGMQVAFAIAKKDSLNAHLYIANYDGTGLMLITQQMNSHSIPSFISRDEGGIEYYALNGAQDSTMDSLGHIHPGFPGNSFITSALVPGGNSAIGGPINPGMTDGARITWRNGINTFAYVDNNQVFTLLTEYQKNLHFIDNGTTPAWSPDGTQLAYNGMDNHIYMTWDLGATKLDLTGANQQSEAISEWSLTSDKILCVSWSGTLGKSAASLKQVNVNTEQTTIASPAYFGYYLK
jgi:hypothetical protein